MKSNRGFSLLETLLYLAIFAIVGGSLFGILTNVIRVSTREMSGDEVSSQLQFAMGTITRLVKDSSAIEMATSTATTTLKLRMSDKAIDPTCISLVGGVLKLAQGPAVAEPSQFASNCAVVTTDLTTSKVVVDSVLFKRLEFPGGHDQVAIDMQLSNTATGANKISRALRSGISRASAATFDADLLPNVDAQYEVGSSIGGKRWKNAAFSGSLIVAGNVGVGTINPQAKLDLVGDFNVSGTINQGKTLWSSAGIQTLYKASVYNDERTRSLYIQTFNDGTNNSDIYQMYGGSLHTNTVVSAPIFKTMVGYPGFAFGKTNTGQFNFYTYASTGTDYSPATPINVMTFTSTGNVGIGTTGPTYKLQVNGNSANTTGVWAVSSDERLKRDILPIGGALQKITALQGVGFNWKDREKDAQFGRVMGFIAQDVEKVLPQWVKEDTDGYKRIETIGMDALLVEAVKEQQKQIESQKKEIEELRTEVNILKNK